MSIMDIDNTVREIIKGGKETGNKFGGNFKINSPTVPKPNYPNTNLLGKLPSDNEIANIIKSALSKVPHIEMAWGEVNVKLKGHEPKKISFKIQ